MEMLKRVARGRKRWNKSITIIIIKKEGEEVIEDKEGKEEEIRERKREEEKFY
jgi:hypothetical protein